MAGVNKVILIGNLGADPEVKHLEGDKVVANISLATTESYKDKSGNRVDNTEWHDLELWDGQARIAEQYLKKGMQLYVEGKIKTDTWQDEQGNNRKKVRIRVLSFTMLGGRPEGGSTASEQQPSGNYANKPAMNSPNPPVMESASTDDDLPF
ncbi:single-stranded DNA-binding protein [Rhodonellum psychrophilum GCM71 = DSM 17998]|uniref:Single-stranded DNA-binding protein n=2 Tax=Rhodonellum TaxID=336827 RepID=U5C1Q8_9BACT|nr:MULTISPECIES: single-stranded DNA-binding protein [Rhodonellum]ERM84003.1 single-stranded DNA-binding protein [Rhodonellum psychrophilum GCM71 = DSM 17998]MDO9552666.1 single-stranded DNA-binding protein [Rhodonellum sp.]SDY42390.1 single-strand binding protein [Rhodonellum ikkaensis]